MSPDFSIIVPCYNQAHFLSQCLDSILQQDFASWEVIIINDGSSDSTQSISLDYCEKDTRIRLISQENYGLSAARNTGLLAARGSRIIFLDADDYLYADCLSSIRQVSGFQRSDLVVQYGYTYVSEDNLTILQSVLPQTGTHWFPDIFIKVPGPCHTICVSADRLRACGGFDESLKSLEDWDMWLRVFKSGIEVSSINRPLSFYRYVKSSMSRNAELMFKSFETVAARACSPDTRINIKSVANKQYDFDMQPVLVRALLRMTAIPVMQGKVSEALQFFKLNFKGDHRSLTTSSFEEMCSYLSFRYWYSEEEIRFVLTELRPRFWDFLSGLGYDKRFAQAALYFIFRRHLYHLNKKKKGRVIGGIMNRLLDFKYGKK